MHSINFYEIKKFAISASTGIFSFKIVVLQCRNSNKIKKINSGTSGSKARTFYLPKYITEELKLDISLSFNL